MKVARVFMRFFLLLGAGVLSAAAFAATQLPRRNVTLGVHFEF